MTEASNLSRPVRVILIVIGTVFVGLGIIGLLLPVVPTTPFLLVAAACYARSSTRFYNALLANPWFGPLIKEWRETGTIPSRAKLIALVLIAVSFGVTIVLILKALWLQIIMLGIAISVSTYLGSIPSKPD